MTEEQLLQFARELIPRWDGAWQVDGRVIGAFEMHALCKLKRAEFEEQIKHNGCCGDGPRDDGTCPHTLRRCPLMREAKQIERRLFNAM